MTYILTGDCLAVMPTLDAESVDAIVSDPPYGLAFMGKAWDHGVPGPEFWREAWRVAKPGAHLVAFGGTRTYHRLTCAIEDAGWEIRDCLSWLYGSGFPKSLDVSKAMDKQAGRVGQSVVAIKSEIRQRYEAQGMTIALFNAACGFEASGYLRESSTWAGVLPSSDKWQAIKRVIGCGDDLDSLFAEAEREVVGYTKRGSSVSTDFMSGGNDITAPATALAREWQGWGTALKPAWEPIILARKPLTGTVASNVAQHGTGALNVDGCRIGTESTRIKRPPNSLGRMNDDGWKPSEGFNGSTLGRWPANVCLDEEAASLFPESRYFYTAKASRREREAGLEGMPVGQPVGGADKWTETDKRRGEGVTREPAANVHPTVKPIALMRWLCRLVTPKGGLILDPFTGSGTTGCAAVLEGFRFVGIEREPEYAAIAEKRIAHWAGQVEEPTLFEAA